MEIRTDYFKDKKIIITGGLGFIGSNLAIRLVNLGAQVTLVDNLLPQYGGNLYNIIEVKDKLVYHITDVRNISEMEKLINGQDVLFNLSGQSSHLDSMRDPLTDLEMNVHAQLSILETCRLNNPSIRVIFASTRQLYGRAAYLPVDERHPLHPIDINGVHKLTAEMYHTLYWEAYGLWTCSLRLTNTYGPRMRVKDARQTFLGVWINHLVQNLPFEVWGGDQLRDFSYVDDVVEAMLLVACSSRAGGRIYNVGGNEVINLRNLADLLIKLHTQGEYFITPFPIDRKGIDIGDYYSDSRAIFHEIDWMASTSLESGLTSTLNYYSKHLSHYI